MAQSRKKQGKQSRARKNDEPSNSDARADAEDASEETPRESIALPPGQHVTLPGRGRIFIRDVAGPPGAPVVLLLHGWFASGGLNWAMAFETLSRHFRVIAPDQRGHGRGIRGWGSFQLEDCADDAAALLDALEIESAIAVGYSMGGPVAQLLWRRHPSKIEGLVMCATSGEPVTAGPVARLAFTSFFSAAAGTARLGQFATHIPISVAGTLVKPLERKEPPLDVLFAVAEMGRHDLRMLFEAGVALGRYRAKDWIRDIDVPTAIVVTTEDRAVIPEGQMHQALEIRDVRIFCIDDGHTAITDPSFAEQLRRACIDVAERAAEAMSPGRRARRRQRMEHAVDALMGEFPA
jgi:pimeloyl-ACP methyl ester carboxylesterase